MIRVDTNLIDSTVRYDFGYSRWWGIGDASDTVIIVVDVIAVVIVVVVVNVVIDLQFSCSGRLTFAMNTFRVHLTCLFDKSLRHRPQMIGLCYHDVGQFTTLCGHTNLSSNIIFVDRMNKSEWINEYKFTSMLGMKRDFEQWLTVVKIVMARWL